MCMITVGQRVAYVLSASFHHRIARRGDQTTRDDSRLNVYQTLFKNVKLTKQETL